MPKLPPIKPKDVVKILVKNGFVIKRQIGNHMRLIHPDGRATTIAIHSKNLPLGTLRAILRQSEIDLKDFLR